MVQDEAVSLLSSDTSANAKRRAPKSRPPRFRVSELSSAGCMQPEPRGLKGIRQSRLKGSAFKALNPKP